MPSTYAHYRMGQQVRTLVCPDAQRVINRYPELYLIGLHGPDILFYYEPLSSNPTNQIGYATHNRSGRQFFGHARQVLAAHPGNDRYLSYTYGLLNHFALDSTCHGYIDEKIHASGISHTEIEVEFDRLLMTQDRKDPVCQSLTDHIVPSRENAAVIQAFYPGTDTDHVERSLRSMIFYNRLLIAPARPKRWLIYALLRLTGNYPEMHGLVVSYQPNPACADSNARLTQLYSQAVNRAVAMIDRFNDGAPYSAGLEALFSCSFGSVLVEEKEAAL